LRAFSELRISDAADVTIVALLLWALIVWLRNTRARFAVAGLAIVFALYLIAQRLGLQLTVWLFQGFFAAAALVMIVVFQDDLRRLFERIAVAGLRRRRPRPGPDTTDCVVDVTAALARARTGALIVLPGRDLLDRYLEGGPFLRGRLSEALLESVFDPHSAGHDGAVVLEGNEVSRFGVHLPLSADTAALGRGGTRHAAALGLCERTDALCIVVSEERGTLSVAQSGQLREVDGAGLRQALADHIRTSNPVRRRSEAAPWLLDAPAHWREGLLAGALALSMWAVLVPEEAAVSMGFAVPVQVANLPDGYEVAGVEPEEVRITLSGPRRNVTLANPANVRIRIDGQPIELGRRTFEISAEAVEHPDHLQIVTVSPARVKLRVTRSEEPS
jgi:uncharacterized protein (TIGR00159 family)